VQGVARSYDQGRTPRPGSETRALAAIMGGCPGQADRFVDLVSLLEFSPEAVRQLFPAGLRQPLPRPRQPQPGARQS
jgi:hypothetical protein